MSRLDVNRSGEMEVFVRVVELGGFSAAARAYRMTPSAISKLVSRMERRLGSRLVNRSTRKLQLTPEGCSFYERSVRLLADLDDAERAVASAEEPRGRMRVHVNVPVGRHFLLPLVPQFLALHPGITLDIVLTDEVVDLLEQRTDVAIRSGPLRSSRLVARKLGETRMMVVASPAYLEKHGVPRKPRELESHNRIGFGYPRTVEGWPFVVGHSPISIAPLGNAQVSDGEGVRQLALGGVGLARLAAFQVRADIAAGRLRSVLEDHNAGDSEEVHAVYLGHAGQLPARIRALLDFLGERMRVS
jgi:DNA-binding transcriptional LysR family regulator